MAIGMCFVDAAGSCIYELTTVVAADIRPLRAQVRPNASMESKVECKVPPLAKALLATDSCWKKFSLRVCWDVDHAPTKDPHIPEHLDRSGWSLWGRGGHKSGWEGKGWVWKELGKSECDQSINKTFSDLMKISHQHHNRDNEKSHSQEANVLMAY